MPTVYRGGYRISEKAGPGTKMRGIHVHMHNIFSLFMKFGCPPKGGGGGPDPQNPSHWIRPWFIQLHNNILRSTEEAVRGGYYGLGLQLPTERVA